MISSKSKANIIDFFTLTFGSILFAYGLTAFTVPNKILPTGVTGLANVIYCLCKIPMGVVNLVINFFLFFLQLKILGVKSAGKTIAFTVISSVAIDILGLFPNAVAITLKDPLVACIYGSLICGIGIALTFKAGGNSGGIDILSQIMEHKWNIPITDTRLASNIAIVLLAGKIYGLEPMLYSIIYIYLINTVIDAFLDGMSVFRNVFVVTSQPDMVSWAIIEELHRGVTIWNGTGAYSGRNVSILMTAVKRGEIHALEKLIYKYDQKAFTVVGDARRVVGRGRGFAPLAQEVRFDEIEVEK